jgi:hypothetical protein
MLSTILSIFAPVLVTEIGKRFLGPAKKSIPKFIWPWISAGLGAALTQVPYTRDLLGHLSPQDAAALGLAGAGAYAGGAKHLLRAVRIAPKKAA